MTRTPYPTQAAPFPKRKLPGLCLRHGLRDEIVFVFGEVLHSGWGRTGPVTQTIQTPHKEWLPDGKIKLIGETYAYWCPNCFKTIWEQEMMMRRAIQREDDQSRPLIVDADGRIGQEFQFSHARSGSVRNQRCPFCEGLISPLQPGDRVRCHYRFSEKGEWGSWWAERWEW
jgi:hypothetical protein